MTSRALYAPAAPAVARAASAETLSDDSTTLQLLLDAGATRGILSAHRVVLRDGVGGANPHHHLRSAEVFHVLDGVAEILAGGEVLTATAGDLVVVPATTPHAFAAARGHDAELLLMITPGVERFDFFRMVHRVRIGLESPEALADPALYVDNHPSASPAWESARGLGPTTDGARP